MTAPNFIEFANTVGALCFPNEAELVGIEVTQTIQDLNNAIVLVEKKPTLVRTYFQPKAGGPTHARIQARLIGRRGGIELPESPLTPSFNPTITAKARALDRRGNLEDSLNFELPLSWRQGTIELEIEPVGTALGCKEDAGPIPGDCKASVAFEKGSEIKVKFVTLTYTDNGETFTPSKESYIKLYRRLKAIYPVTNVDVEISALTLPDGKPQASDILSKLDIKRFLDNIYAFFGFSSSLKAVDFDRFHYGILAENGKLFSDSRTIGGMASLSSNDKSYPSPMFQTI